MATIIKFFFILLFPLFFLREENYQLPFDAISWRFKEDIKYNILREITIPPQIS